MTQSCEFPPESRFATLSMLAHLSMRFVSSATTSGSISVAGRRDIIEARLLSFRIPWDGRAQVGSGLSVADEADEEGFEGRGFVEGRDWKGAEERVARRLCWEERAAG